MRLGKNGKKNHTHTDTQRRTETVESTHHILRIQAESGRSSIEKLFDFRDCRRHTLCLLKGSRLLCTSTLASSGQAAANLESMSSTSTDGAATIGSGDGNTSSSSSSSSSSSASQTAADDSTAALPGVPAAAAGTSDSADSGPQPTPELMQQRSHVMADFAAAADERNRLIEKEQRRLRKEDRYVKVRTLVVFVSVVLSFWLCCSRFLPAPASERRTLGRSWWFSFCLVLMF